jgi:hypothetical protein
MAAPSRLRQLVQSLVDNNVDVNVQVGEYDSALFGASERTDTEPVKLLESFSVLGYKFLE